MSSVPALIVPFEDTGLLKYRRDALLDAANDGDRLALDLAFGFSYPGGPAAGRPAATAPFHTRPIYDVAERGDAVFETVSSGVNYAGGGFDFSGVTARRHEIVGPAEALADIISGDQHFMVMFYAKLPTVAGWYAESGIIPFFCTTTNNAGFAAETDLLSIGMISGAQLRAARMTTAIGTVETSTVTLTTASNGLVSQVLYWRNSAGAGIRVKNAGETKMTVIATGARNALDLSGKRPRFGVAQSLWDFATRPSLATAKNWRLYRMYIENLEVSGRSPWQVADADYERTMARGVFS